MKRSAESCTANAVGTQKQRWNSSFTGKNQDWCAEGKPKSAFRPLKKSGSPVLST